MLLLCYVLPSNKPTSIVYALDIVFLVQWLIKTTKQPKCSLTIGTIADYFLARIGIDIVHGTVENFSICDIIYEDGFYVSRDRPVRNEIRLIKALVSIFSVDLDNRVCGGVPRPCL